MTRAAPAETRAQIVEQYYRPHRMQVERLVRQAVARGHRVIHISSHSFTAELDGKSALTCLNTLCPRQDSNLRHRLWKLR